MNYNKIESVLPDFSDKNKICPNVCRGILDKFLIHFIIYDFCSVSKKNLSLFVLQKTYLMFDGSIPITSGRSLIFSGYPGFHHQ